MALDFAATYKILVLGDSNVGKTCIVHRYCDERYYDTYISTIGEWWHTDSVKPLIFEFLCFFRFQYSSEQVNIYVKQCFRDINAQNLFSSLIPTIETNSSVLCQMNYTYVTAAMKNMQVVLSTDSFCTLSIASGQRTTTFRRPENPPSSGGAGIWGELSVLGRLDTASLKTDGLIPIPTEEGGRCSVPNTTVF